MWSKVWDLRFRSHPPQPSTKLLGGTAAIARFLRPVAYQGWPDAMLPPEPRDANPLAIHRQVGPTITTDPIERAR